MQKVAVVTGGGSGLGQTIAKQLAQKNIHVFIIGRRLHKLKETQAFSPTLITPLCADITLPKARQQIKKSLKNIPIHYLIHNAAIVFPINPLEKITLKDFRKIMRTNLEAPLFLTQTLLPSISQEGRILHISSDCAHYSLAHWIPYCSSKSALFMMVQCLKKEFAEKNIAIGSIDPGMMDTPMQHAILDEDIQFPEKYSLDELQKQGILFSPDYSATQCVKLLLETSRTHFEKNEHHVQ